MLFWFWMFFLFSFFSISLNLYLIDFNNCDIFFIKKITEVFLFKGTVTVILISSPCKDGNAPCTTVLSKGLSDQVWIRYQCFCFLELFIFIWGFSAKLTRACFVFKKLRRNSHKQSGSAKRVRKTTVTSTFLIRLRLHHCIGHCYLWMEGHLKLGLQSLYEILNFWSDQRKVRYFQL